MLLRWIFPILYFLLSLNLSQKLLSVYLRLIIMLIYVLRLYLLRLMRRTFTSQYASSCWRSNLMAFYIHIARPGM